MNRYGNISPGHHAATMSIQGFLPFPPVDLKKEGFPSGYSGEDIVNHDAGYDPVRSVMNLFSGTVVHFRGKGRPIDDIFPPEKNGRNRVPAARPARQSPI